MVPIHSSLALATALDPAISIFAPRLSFKFENQAES